MNKHKFKRWVLSMILLYILVIILAFVLGKFASSEEPNLYTTFIDLVPLIIAGSLAWLGYCFQRHQTYLRNIRELWLKIVASVEEAIYYTRPDGDWKQYKHETILKDLSIVIDEVRAIFGNIGANKNRRGLYPLESLKTIQRKIDEMEPRSGETCPKRVSQTHKEIVKLYQKLQGPFLAELALETPRNVDSPYV